MNFYKFKFLRNPLTKNQQEKIRKTKFTIVGLGGTGGFILENLLRLGAENIIVFDHDRFELSNFNRQTLATDEFLDIPKVHAAIARAKTINKNINLKTFRKFDEDTDINTTDMLLDGTDNLESKLLMARMARDKKIPYVFCSAQSTRGMVTIFTTYKFEKAFQLAGKDIDNFSSCSSIMCPAASLAGTLAVSQAMNFLLKKPITKAPNAIFFDLYKKEIFWKAKLG
ncbi:ThiF family protein [Candidatus Bilamarchaeum dharawalense]|uniref:ThiF family protein n=1 Tax=Candidatus Bilamarchaeum dharawalense TaxID=2885759 RepID=A0A5E4LW87_9ARCH|nr:ThiF family protein [Candidatus Bilamarchaeum dharawalense]